MLYGFRDFRASGIRRAEAFGVQGFAFEALRDLGFRPKP